MRKYVSLYVVLLVSFVFYVFTLAPTVIGGDSPSFCLKVHNFALHFGKASDHPLHTVLGKIFSFLPFELAFNLNLMSAFFGSLTVLLVFLIVKYLTHSDIAALFGALSLMVSHAFWLHSVIAEVYTLHVFFLALLMYLTLTRLKSRWFKFLFPIVFILGLLNHLILLLTLPAFLVYILIKIDAKQRKLILMVGTFLGTLAVIIFLGLFIFRNQAMKAWLQAILIGPPSIKHYLFPPAGVKVLLKEGLFYLLYLAYQFPIGGMILGALGIVQMLKKEKAAALLLLLCMGLNGLFFIKTTSWGSYGGTKYTFYISDYTIFSMFLGYGAFTLFTLLKRWKSLQGTKRQDVLPLAIISASVILTVSFYALMPQIMSYLSIDLLHARTLPYRENNTFFLNPNKRGYYGDRKFGEDMLALSQQNSVIFADFTPHTILNYLQKIDKMRPDVKLIYCDEKTPLRERIDSIKREQPDTHIYLADNNSYYKLEKIEEKYSIKEYGPFFEIK